MSGGGASRLAELLPGRLRPIFSLVARCRSWRCAMDFIHELLVQDNSYIIGIRSLPATMLTLNFCTAPVLDTVRRAWRRLIKNYHLDLYSADEDKKRLTADLVQGLNRACEELGTHLERK